MVLPAYGGKLHRKRDSEELTEYRQRKGAVIFLQFLILRGQSLKIGHTVPSFSFRIYIKALEQITKHIT